jgi:hypothetical protein
MGRDDMLSYVLAASEFGVWNGVQPANLISKDFTNLLLPIEGPSMSRAT